MPKPTPRTGKEYEPELPSPVIVEMTINGQKVFQRRFSPETLRKMCQVDDGYHPYKGATEVHKLVSTTLQKKQDLVRTIEIAMAGKTARKQKLRF